MGRTCYLKQVWIFKHTNLQWTLSPQSNEIYQLIYIYIYTAYHQNKDRNVSFTHLTASSLSRFFLLFLGARDPAQLVCLVLAHEEARWRTQSQLQIWPLSNAPRQRQQHSDGSHARSAILYQLHHQRSHEPVLWLPLHWQCLLPTQQRLWCVLQRWASRWVTKRRTAGGS